MSKTGDIFQSAMMEDIRVVTDSGDKERLLKIHVTLHSEKEDFEPISVMSFENMRDYYKQTGESFFLTLQIGFGDYVWRLLPFKEHLEATVLLTYYTEDGDKSKDIKPQETRYKALINSLKNVNVDSDSLANKSLEELNLLTPLDIKLELVDRREELLRLLQIDGIYANHTTDQLLRGLFMQEANNWKVDGKPLLEALDMDDSDNTRPYPHLLLPSKIFLRDLPGWLQENAKGVYTAGIGSFFQVFNNKPTWFNFPLYRSSRFDEDREKLIVYAVPPEKMPRMDKTFRTEGKTTYIISTGNKKQADLARNNELNDGVGFRMPDAESFLKKPVEVQEEGFKANRHRLNHEVRSYQRKDQVGYSPTRKSAASAFMEYSRILANNFSAVSVVWENSDPTILYPGMPIKYAAMDKGKYIEAKGILIKVYNLITLQGNPAAGGRHRGSTVLSLLIEVPENLPSNEEGTSLGEKR